MGMRQGGGFLRSVLLGLGALALLGSEPASAESYRRPFYVEFRSVDIGVYGHSYIVYGRLSDGGRALTAQYADFHPKGGDLGMVVGHFLPVGGDLIPDKETQLLPIVARYRRSLDEAEYRNLVAALARVRENPHPWNALANNCNSFVGEMAQAVGLRAPPSLILAHEYVSALRTLNEGGMKSAGTRPRGPSPTHQL
jgi:hypothetical protein